MFGLSLADICTAGCGVESVCALWPFWVRTTNWGELQKRRRHREGENPVPHYWDHVMWVFDKPI